MFSDKLKSLRESKNLTKADLARILDIPYTTYNGYETGAREPNFDQVKKIAAALNVTANDLMYWEQYDETHKEQIKGIREFDAFISYLEKIAYAVNIEPECEDSFSAWLTKNGKQYTFNDEEFKELQKSIQEYIDFQISRKSK